MCIFCIICTEKIQHLFFDCKLANRFGITVVQFSVNAKINMYLIFFFFFLFSDEFGRVLDLILIFMKCYI